MADPKTVRLFAPSLTQMSLRARWLADPAMMSYNAGWGLDDDRYDDATGCFEFPESDWAPWHRRWVGGAEDRRYWFAEDETGEVVGHAHFRLDPAPGGVVAHIGLNVVPSRRGAGLGHALLAALVEAVRTDGRAAVAHNEFEDSRVSAVRIHEAAGFRRGEVTGRAHDGSDVAVWELALRP